MTKLLDLSDYDLNLIFVNLNRKSRLQLMKVCKRFEILIGNNPQFYKDFHLKISKYFWEDQKNVQALMEIRRKFSKITIHDFKFEEIDADAKLTTFFTRNGSVFSEICFKYCKIDSLMFLKLVTSSQNVRRLRLENVNFKTDEIPADPPIILQNLKHFRIFFSDVPEILPAIMPKSLECLKISGYYRENQNFCSNLQEILAKQESLEKMTMSYVRFENFEPPVGISSLLKLKLERILIETSECKRNFTNFMKNQEKIRKLHVEIYGLDYSEMLTHLFNLRSLEVVDFCCSKFAFESYYSDLQISNPSVKSLKIFSMEPIEINYPAFVRYFPQVSCLTITERPSSWEEKLQLKTNFDLSSINLWNIRKLEIAFMTNRILDQINLGGLQELKITKYHASRKYPDLGSWYRFVKRHNQLEKLDLQEIFFEHHADYLECAMNCLPKLKHLAMEVCSEETGFEDHVVATIVRHFERFEYLDISMKVRGPKKYLKYLRKQFGELNLTFNADKERVYITLGTGKVDARFKNADKIAFILGMWTEQDE